MKKIEVPVKVEDLKAIADLIERATDKKGGVTSTEMRRATKQLRQFMEEPGIFALSEKKKRRAWNKAAKRLAGQDMDTFLAEFDGRWKRLQRLFWLSFSVNVIIAILWHLK